MKWNYCECGYHQSTVSVGSLMFSLANDYNGRYTLYKDHGLDQTKLGVFTSTKAVSLALLPLAKQEQYDLERKLREVKRLIEEIE